MGRRYMVWNSLSFIHLFIYFVVCFIFVCGKKFRGESYEMSCGRASISSNSKFSNGTIFDPINWSVWNIKSSSMKFGNAQASEHTSLHPYKYFAITNSDRCPRTLKRNCICSNRTNFQYYYFINNKCFTWHTVHTEHKANKQLVKVCELILKWKANIGTDTERMSD